MKNGFHRGSRIDAREVVKGVGTPGIALLTPTDQADRAAQSATVVRTPVALRAASVLTTINKDDREPRLRGKERRTIDNTDTAETLT